MMSGTLLHMPTISFPTFMIFSLTLFSYPPIVIFEIKVQDSFLPRPSDSKDLVLFPINETSVFLGGGTNASGALLVAGRPQRRIFCELKNFICHVMHI